jgi:hypothetical protein
MAVSIGRVVANFSTTQYVEDNVQLHNKRWRTPEILLASSKNIGRPINHERSKRLAA